MSDSSSVSGSRLAVVTGGSRGIGRAIVESFAAAGTHVLATGRDPNALNAIATHAGQCGWKVTTAVCDVTDEAAVEALFASAGPVDVLVANAGMGESAPLARTGLDDWNQHLAVNATGAFLCLRAALPRMRTRGRGRVVIVASVAGLRASPYIAAYAASKHAAIGLMRAAAAEVAGSGVTVNAVCPGYVHTDMTQRTVDRIVATTGRTHDKALEALIDQMPLGRLIEPEEVAAAVTYLCADEAAAVNGQAIVLDGGGS